MAGVDTPAEEAEGKNAVRPEEREGEGGETEELGAEAKAPWRVREPGDPTPEERAQHELTHLPFRSWCRYCVMGRGRQEGHFRQNAKESSDNLPEISLDYAFPASEGGVGVTMLVARERRTRMTCATVVPKKGTTGAFAAKGWRIPQRARGGQDGHHPEVRRGAGDQGSD